MIVTLGLISSVVSVTVTDLHVRVLHQAPHFSTFIYFNGTQQKYLNPWDRVGKCGSRTDTLQSLYYTSYYNTPHYNTDHVHPL